MSRSPKYEFVADNTVNKLKLLFLFDKMEIPLTETSLIDICTSRNNWLNYMEFKDLLYQLIDVDLVIKTVDSEQECRYVISNEGRNCLSHFFTKIPASLREQMTTFAKEKRMDYKRDQEYISKYIKNSDGTHTAILKIISPLETQSTLEIRLNLPTRASAISVCKKWRENAPQVYDTIFEILGD